MAEREKLLEHRPLMDFFRERVQKALVSKQVAASALLEFYVVNLLQDFRKTESLFERQGATMQEKPLALILAQAIQGDANTKIRCLKRLGDLSLYTAGFFGESIRKKMVDIDYYIGMGGAAYQSLSLLLATQKTFAELYTELSKRFSDLVKVLAEVSVSTEWQTNQDLLKLYERWLTTRDGSLENTLRQAGIVTQDKETLNKIQ